MEKDYKKLYEEALERAKYWAEGKCMEDFYDSPQNVLNFIFPETKESEDEKIRKWIINEIKIKHHNLDEDNVDFVDKAIAWLEKQGEQGEYKSSWGEEDEKMLDRITDYFEWGIDYFFDENDCNKAQDWIKSLKERLQPKQELSENVIVNEYIRDDKLWEK